MNNPLLSICIPTYNRAAFLRQCLESIVVQFDGRQLAEQIEIVVSDNASTDGTEVVVEEYQSRFLNVNYYKNPKNVGFDRNAIQLVERARGEYVWFLGDDDALFPDALQYVVTELLKGKFTYCIVNCWGYNNSLTEMALGKPNSDISENLYFQRLADYFRGVKPNKDLVGFFCGLSVQIFKRELWLAFPNKEKYIGSNAIHLYILLSAMKEYPFALLPKPLVKVRADNIRWDVFPGLESIQKRTKSTTTILLWILKFYELPHSKLLIRLEYYKNLVESWIVYVARNKVLKTQSSRDKIKKILGKL